MADRQYDVVVLGASGFTGRLVAEYLLQQYGTDGDLKWAVAGRNESKLQEVMQEIAGSRAQQIPVIVVDSSDDGALQAMAASTVTVCTTVGPYALYGSGVVKACAEAGTHYCDLTGEVQWMRQMIDEHQTAAEMSGARIVFTCGFDSIPSDLGVLYVQDEMQARHGAYATRVKYRVVGSSGAVSGGTVASMMNMMEEARENPALLEVLADPYSLNPVNMPRGEDGPDQTGVEYDEDFHQWTAPFVMAGINTRVVRRSHSLLGYPWGEHFRYDEAMLTGDGPGGFARASLVTGGMGLIMGAAAMAPTRKLLGRIAPSPGEGPSKEQRENGYFDIELFASHPEDPAKNLVAKVTGDRDPGYGATAKMLAEAAVCLAKDELDSKPGMLTPAVAMGQHLISRLADSAGMTFSIK